MRSVERKPDPGDRRATLICPTERGLLQMEAAVSIMRTIEERHAKAAGQQGYAAFKAALHRVADLQRKIQHDSQGAQTRSARPGDQ
ncbi:hypothetical protein [Streptomyces olivochromogenes]|uniref:MarR family transcriptional regulator n=1 Tax=Streptomyces olivochromogenes TaxID=1963 RepID=A0A250VQI8_STROL|nr:hypothetical protein [Streptomyces olivochromogenes]GAX56240.1 hypothetical protein SO3561_07807 [Streptomyces olivochromogenes]